MQYKCKSQSPDFSALKYNFISSTPLQYVYQSLIVLSVSAERSQMFLNFWKTISSSSSSLDNKHLWSSIQPENISANFSVGKKNSIFFKRIILRAACVKKCARKARE